MVFGHVEKRDIESGAMLDVGGLNEVSITNLSPQEISCFQHDQKPCFCCFLLKLPKKVPNLGQNIKIYSVSIHIVGLYGRMGDKSRGGNWSTIVPKKGLLVHLD